MVGSCPDWRQTRAIGIVLSPGLILAGAQRSLSVLGVCGLIFLALWLLCYASNFMWSHRW